MTSSDTENTTRRYDLLVVGGGIHGVGVAQAAAAAGNSVLTLEKRALAHGTSSKSSKLIHGGLRYLETFDISLVRESLQERERLLRIAPTLVHRQPFLIPVYPSTSRGALKLRLGLSLYWTLAGWRAKTGFQRIPSKQWNTLDGLATRDLKSVWQYWDAQTDDRRLTQAVMHSAQSLGATLHCPAELLEANVRTDGCSVRYRLKDQTHTIEVDAIVNAAGPWAVDVANRISPSPPVPRVDLVQGTHIEVPGKIQRGCYYVESPLDGRAVFVMPWKDRTMVGTTEKLHRGDPDQCAPTQQEVDYLLAVYQHYFPGRSQELLDQWAGLRVLPATDQAASRRSRETQLPVNDADRPRVISIVGGKLTGYRATAEKVMSKLKSTLPRRDPRGDTATLVLQ